MNQEELLAIELLTAKVGQKDSSVEVKLWGSYSLGNPAVADLQVIKVIT